MSGDGFLALRATPIDGLGPTAAGSAANGYEYDVRTTATLSTELPKATGPGPQANVDGSTSAGVRRYARKMTFLAIDANVCIRFGNLNPGQGLGAAIDDDFCMAKGMPYVLSRRPGLTHMSWISEDEMTTGRLKIIVNEWELEGRF